MKIVHLIALCAILSGSSFSLAEEPKPSGPPQWLLKAENALLGKWINENQATRSTPKMEILREGSILKIRLWGRTGSTETPFGPPDALYVLSDHSEAANRSEKSPSAIAFATHKAGFAIKHFTLRLSDGSLRMEGVTLFTDDSKRSNRIAVETFRKE